MPQPVSPCHSTNCLTYRVNNILDLQQMMKNGDKSKMSVLSHFDKSLSMGGLCGWSDAHLLYTFNMAALFCHPSGHL